MSGCFDFIDTKQEPILQPILLETYLLACMKCSLFGAWLCHNLDMNLAYRITLAVILVVTFTCNTNGKIVCMKVSEGDIGLLLHLDCNRNQMIHVVSESVGKANNSLTSCGISTEDSNCTEYHVGNKTGLIVNSNGISSYYEFMVKPSMSDCPELRDAAVEIEYECVEGSVDICSSNSVKDGNPLYLHSPGFPAADQKVSHCVCTVSGDDMHMMLLHHVSTNGAFWMHNGTHIVWSTSTYLTITYNRNISTPYDRHLTMYYNNARALRGHGIWIRITGAKTIVCTDATLPQPSTTCSTMAESTTSQTTSKTTTSPEITTYTNITTQHVAILVCGCLLIIALVIAVSVLSIKFHLYRKTCPPVKAEETILKTDVSCQTDSPTQNPCHHNHDRAPVDHNGVYLDLEDANNAYAVLGEHDRPGDPDYMSLS